jgi:hypothetical protein
MFRHTVRLRYGSLRGASVRGLAIVAGSGVAKVAQTYKGLAATLVAVAVRLSYGQTQIQRLLPPLMRVVALDTLAEDFLPVSQQVEAEVPVGVSAALQMELMLEELEMAVMVVKVLHQRQKQGKTVVVNWASQAAGPSLKVAVLVVRLTPKSKSVINSRSPHPTHRVTSPRMSNNA